ncbi:MAG TPA: glycosyltransferase family 39 protein [Allocoleopsis sp.]
MAKAGSIWGQTWHKLWNKIWGKGSDAVPHWLRYVLLGLLLLGIFFRFYHLDYKVYWVDEAHTSLRMSGHTKTELEQEVFSQTTVSVDRLQQYQHLSPDRGWDATLNSLQGNAEHAPLYFLLSRLWVEGFGYSVAVMRSLPALISLLVFPAIGWLCWELFGSARVAWVAVGLVAISPLHVLYAQEARPYSLWTAMILLSSAVLLRAMRQSARWKWMIYSLIVAIGLYTQLLFSLVAMAHGLYVLLVEVIPKRRFSQTAISYAIATTAAFLAFVPWLLVLFGNLEQTQQTIGALAERESFSYLLNQWFSNASLILFDRNLNSLNIISVLLIVAALVSFCRIATGPVRVFILSLIGVSTLALVIPDLVLGGERSIRLRYFFPAILGIQIILAYLFSTQAIRPRSWTQWTWRVVAIGLVSVGITACLVSSQSQIWWSKNPPRSAYYPEVAQLINQTNQPLIITQGPVVDMVAFSYWLDSDVSFQFVDRPNQIKIPAGINTVFLLNPSRRMLNQLPKQGYQLTLLFEDNVDGGKMEKRLWSIRRLD